MGNLKEEIVKKWSKNFSINSNLDFNTAMGNAMDEYLAESNKAKANVLPDEAKSPLHGVIAKLDDRLTRQIELCEKANERAGKLQKELEELSEKRNGLFEQIKECLQKYEQLKEVALNLFDNRLGWSDGRNPYAPRHFWGLLGEVLYGAEDQRVIDLKNEPTISKEESVDNPNPQEDNSGGDGNEETSG